MEVKIKISADTIQFYKQLEELIADLKKIGKISSVFGIDTKEADKSLAVIKDKLDNLSKEKTIKLDGNSKDFDEVFTKIDNKIKTVKNPEIKFKLTNLRNILTDLARVGLAVDGVKRIAWMMESILDPLLSFEQNMANIGSISQLTKKDLQEAGEVLTNISNELGIGANELAKAQYQAISGNIETSQSLNFVEDSAKTAQAGLADVTSVVDLLTTVMNGFNLEADKAGYVSDIFFKIVEKGKTTIPELSQYFGDLVSTLDVANISLEESGAAMALLTRTMGTSKAVVALNNALFALASPTDQAKKKIREMNLDIYDMNGNLKNLSDIVEQFTDKKLTLQEWAEIIPEKRASKAMTTLVNQSKEYLELIDVMKNSEGARDRAFIKNTDTKLHKLQQLKAQFENTYRDFLIEFSPLIDKALTNTSSFIELLSEHQDLVVNLFKAAVIYKFSSGLSNVITQIGTMRAGLAAAQSSAAAFSAALSVAGLAAAAGYAAIGAINSYYDKKFAKQDRELKKSIEMTQELQNQDKITKKLYEDRKRFMEEKIDNSTGIAKIDAKDELRKLDEIYNKIKAHRKEAWSAISLYDQADNSEDKAKAEAMIQYWLLQISEEEKALRTIQETEEANWDTLYEKRRQNYKTEEGYLKMLLQRKVYLESIGELNANENKELETVNNLINQSNKNITKYKQLLESIKYDDFKKHIEAMGKEGLELKLFQIDNTENKELEKLDEMKTALESEGKSYENYEADKTVITNYYAKERDKARKDEIKNSKSEYEKYYQELIKETDSTEKSIGNLTQRLVELKNIPEGSLSLINKGEIEAIEGLLRKLQITQNKSKQANRGKQDKDFAELWDDEGKKLSKTGDEIAFDFSKSITDAMSKSFKDGIADMILEAKSFEDVMLALWDSIKVAAVNAIAEIIVEQAKLAAIKGGMGALGGLGFIGGAIGIMGGLFGLADGGEIPVKVSNGEAYLSPQDVNSIGLDNVMKLNNTGRIMGAGTETSDSILAFAQRGGFVLNAQAVKILGNIRGLASGGLIDEARFVSRSGFSVPVSSDNSDMQTVISLLSQLVRKGQSTTIQNYLDKKQISEEVITEQEFKNKIRIKGRK